MSNETKEAPDSQRRLHTGDVIKTRVKTDGNDLLVAEAEGWHPVLHLRFRGETPAVNEGDYILAKVISASKYGAYISLVTDLGPIIESEVEYGSSVAVPVDDTLRVELHLKKPSAMSGIAKVRLAEVSKQITGQILSYEGNPPELGQCLRGQLERGRGPHGLYGPNQSYIVQVNEDVLVSGNVEIEITKIGAPSIAKITSYCGNLPEIGDCVRTKVTSGSGSQEVQPFIEDYKIRLHEDVLVTSEAEIEVTDHGLPMKGKIKSYCGNLPEIGEEIYVELGAGSGPQRFQSPSQSYAIRVNEDVLISDVVEIEITEHGLPMEGRVSSYRGNLPKIGHRFRANVKYGSGHQLIQSPDQRYRVRINEDVLLTGEAEIEITEHGLPMEGRVNSYFGGLPEVGDRLHMDVKYGSGPHQLLSPSQKYGFQIDENILASGEVEIELTERGLPMKGKIKSYCGNLPEVGSIVTARVRANQKTVEPQEKDFQVELDRRVPESGRINVRITDISNAIRGKIIDFYKTGQDLSSYNSPRRASMVDNTDIRRKKL